MEVAPPTPMFTHVSMKVSERSGHLKLSDRKKILSSSSGLRPGVSKSAAIFCWSLPVSFNNVSFSLTTFFWSSGHMPILSYLPSSHPIAR